MDTRDYAFSFSLHGGISVEHPAGDVAGARAKASKAIAAQLNVEKETPGTLASGVAGSTEVGITLTDFDVSETEI